jgi:hypothetical protein
MQVHEEATLPARYRLNVTYATVDLDPGDPETGPAPNICTIPIKWTLTHAATGHVICRGALADDDSQTWMDGDDPTTDVHTAIYEAFARRGISSNEVAYYLHENGLI